MRNFNAEDWNEALRQGKWERCARLARPLLQTDFGRWFNLTTRLDRERKWRTGEYRDFSTARDLEMSQEQS